MKINIDNKSFVVFSVFTVYYLYLSLQLSVIPFQLNNIIHLITYVNIKVLHFLLIVFHLIILYRNEVA